MYFQLGRVQTYTDFRVWHNHNGIFATGLNTLPKLYIACSQRLKELTHAFRLREEANNNCIHMRRIIITLHVYIVTNLTTKTRPTLALAHCRMHQLCSVDTRPLMSGSSNQSEPSGCATTQQDCSQLG